MGFVAAVVEGLFGYQVLALDGLLGPGKGESDALDPLRQHFRAAEQLRDGQGDFLSDDLAGALSDGTLAFQLQRLAELPLAAVVVEARYAALYKLEHVDGGWLADQLARLAVRYPEVQLVFADSRRYAEDWTYRFLASAFADVSDLDASR